MVELTRLPTRALANATYGVNVQLRGLERFAGDSQPPPIVRFFDFTSDLALDEAGQQSSSLDFPAIMVSLQNAIDTGIEFGENQNLGPTSELIDMPQVDIFFDYVVPEGDSAYRIRDVLYTLRAIIRCLHVWMDQGNIDDRSANNMQFITQNRFTFGPVTHKVEQGTIVGSVIAGFFVRDINPFGRA